jgi:ABC-type hemin transport system substrate-binding protein
VTTSGAADRTPASPDDPRLLAEEIERTREQLGETVEALAAKVDVKARAQEKANQLTERVEAKARRAAKTVQQMRRRPVPLAVSAGVVGAAVVVTLLIMRWRRR